MKWIESFITYCFPKILLDGKPWRAMWEEKDQQQFVTICKVFFFAAGVGYIGHFFFYDIPMGLHPIEDWLLFRSAAAAASFLAMFFYFSPLANTKLRKLPAIAATWLYCYTQAMITTWWDGTPWLYSFVFVSGCVMVVRASPLSTVVLAVIFMASQAPYLLEAGVPLSSIVSTAFVTIILVLILKSSYAADIRNFVLSQENIAAQKKLIELNIEFSDRLKAFIPKVIADRIETLVTQKQTSVLQAAVEVLRPRRTKVACLFSDIRGFTKDAKQLDAFIGQSVFPEMKACSNAVEEYGGIPRKIGDLIFAYFDAGDSSQNVIRCLLSGIAISRMNHELNSRGAGSEIRRYILVSTGEAIVGNLGGLDSSVEITALGPPVNFLSRLDELTKSPYLRSRLVPGDVLVCANTLESLKQSGIEIDVDSIDLLDEGLVVRDFPEVTTIYRLQEPTRTYEILHSRYDQSSNKSAATSGERYYDLTLA
jgi:class 3 adenylate cyclase